jgi:hypothetical protein
MNLKLTESFSIQQNQIMWKNIYSEHYNTHKLGYINEKEEPIKDNFVFCKEEKDKLFETFVKLYNEKKGV